MEAFTNKVAHLFVVHMINTLDDTIHTRKRLLVDMLRHAEDLSTDKYYQTVFCGIFMPNSNAYFSDEDRIAFSAFKEHSTSKKAPEQRKKEILAIIMGPLAKFYEEHMTFMLQDSHNFMLREYLSELMREGADSQEDLIDEIVRQLKSMATYPDGGKGPLMGHQDTHRLVKHLVRVEVEAHENKIPFSEKVASVITKQFEAMLPTRAVFIIIELIEKAATKKLI